MELQNSSKQAGDSLGEMQREGSLRGPPGPAPGTSMETHVGMLLATRRSLYLDPAPTGSLLLTWMESGCILRWSLTSSKIP